MNEPTKLTIKRAEKEQETASSLQAWRAPFQNLRREIDSLFDDFDGSVWSPLFRRPFLDVRQSWLRDMNWATAPAVDVMETDKAYEITVELPGLDEKNVEVNLVNGSLVIKGEKQEEKEEHKKGYHMHERQYGTFERSFRLPEEVDSDKINASFKKGVLTVVLPKTAEAQKPEKKITVKAA